MNMKLLRIMIVIFFAVLTYEFADRRNNTSISNIENEYLPKKPWKGGDLFWFSKKNQPIRWIAYWVERITQIIMSLFFLSLIIGNMITGSWEFITIEYVGCWGGLLYLYPVIFEIGVDIYLFLRRLLDKG